VLPRLALLAAVVAAALPATALADDPPAQPPPDQASQAAPDQPSQPSCLAATGAAPDATGIRGVHVGNRAVIKDANGDPMKVASVKYCVNGGGTFSFALSRDSDVVLALSTADGDAIGQINPSSPATSARMAFPKMKRLNHGGATAVYRVDSRRQLILGVAGGRVSFVAAADRLLLEYPNKLGYYLHRLGF
jgi:hypothetical protein